MVAAARRLPTLAPHHVVEFLPLFTVNVDESCLSPHVEGESSAYQAPAAVRTAPGAVRPAI